MGRGRGQGVRAGGAGGLPVLSRESLRFSFNVCQPSGVRCGCPGGAVPAAAGEGGDGPALSSASHLGLDLAAGGGGL